MAQLEQRKLVNLSVRHVVSIETQNREANRDAESSVLLAAGGNEEDAQLSLMAPKKRKRYCILVVQICEEETLRVFSNWVRKNTVFFLSGLEKTPGSHGVLADTWDADHTARS